MATRLNIILTFLSHYKYLIVIVGGLLVVGVLDENSYLKLWKYHDEISKLKDEINRYKKQDELSTRRLHMLEKDPRGVERIARERYMMKTDDEDIFVLSTDKQPEDDNKDENSFLEGDDAE